jgi:hypothetical protein
VKPRSGPPRRQRAEIFSSCASVSGSSASSGWTSAESVRLDDRLVADVERAEPRVAPERQQRLARAEHGDAEAVHLRERERVAHERGERVRRPHGVARDEQDAPLDPVAE